MTVSELLSKDTYNKERVDVQKSLLLLNRNFEDVYERVKKCEQVDSGMQVAVEGLLKSKQSMMA